MENQIFRIDINKKDYLEFFICSTNEIDPYKKIKEVGIVNFASDIQSDISLDEDQVKSLIKYLTDCSDYIMEYNQKSKPVTP